jgi:H+/Cl- antiporter ClcA
MHLDDTRRDFAADPRLFQGALIAVVVGALSTVTAWFLLFLIRLFTNFFFFQTLSGAARSPAANTLGLWVIAVPVAGGLIIGLIARFGTEKVRGHGIPEAIEAILFGKSKMSPKVAVLKPLASGIAIGSGGPFGAEGPIIMTGGALGSLVAQHFHVTSAERKTLLVAGAVAGMTAVFGTPVAAVLLAVELLLFELRPRSLLPVAVACAVAGFLRPLLMDSGPLFPLQTSLVGPLGLVSCVIAGLASGLMSWGLSNLLYKVEDLFAKLPVHWMWWPAIGGIAVGIWRILSTPRPGCRLRRNWRPFAEPSRNRYSAGLAGLQGCHLGNCPWIGHFGRRVGTATDDGRRARGVSRSIHARRPTHPMASCLYGGNPRRHDARPDHGGRVRA